MFCVCGVAGMCEVCGMGGYVVWCVDVLCGGCVCNVCILGMCGVGGMCVVCGMGCVV